VPGQQNLLSSTHGQTAAACALLRHRRRDQEGIALARCGKLPPGFVDVFHPEVRKRFQDRVGSVTLLQIPPYGPDSDPSASEYRSAGVHAPALFNMARLVSRTPCRLIDTQPKRIQENRLDKDDLIWLQVAFPRAVRMLEVGRTSTADTVRTPRLIDSPAAGIRCCP
jgi:hypothetical protein